MHEPTLSYSSHSWFSGQATSTGARNFVVSHLFVMQNLGWQAIGGMGTPFAPSYLSVCRSVQTLNEFCENCLNFLYMNSVLPSRLGVL